IGAEGGGVDGGGRRRGDDRTLVGEGAGNGEEGKPRQGEAEAAHGLCRDGKRHVLGHCNTSSAWSAPALLMLWRMEMIPSGLTPMLFSPETSERRLEPSRIATWPPSCWARMSVFGSAAVSPRENGSGWMMRGISLTCTVSEP